MKSKKKHATIRLLSCLLAIIMALSGITPAFASSGSHYETQSSKLSVSGGGDKDDGRKQNYEYQIDRSALKVSLIVTSTDGLSKYNPSLNKGVKDNSQPLYRDLTPLGLSCNTKAFSGLTADSTMGWYGIGGCYIFEPSSWKGPGAQYSGGRGIEGAVERTSDGKWTWNKDNNNVAKYRITKGTLDAAYKEATKQKDVNGKKVKIDPENKDGVTAGDLYSRFLYNTKTFNSILNVQGKEFLKVGFITISPEKAEKPEYQVKMAGNRAILYTLLSAMKSVHSGDKDKELNKLFDKALAATLGEETEFKYVLMFELASALYSDYSNDVYYLTTNNITAASLCGTAKELRDFPARNKSSEPIKASSSSSSGKISAGGSSGSGKTASTNRNMGLRDYLSKIEGMNSSSGAGWKNRKSRMVNGSHRFWLGQDFGDDAVHLTGREQISCKKGSTNPAEKKPEILAPRMCYSGPIANDPKEGEKRAAGFISGRWGDSSEEIKDNTNETYQWGWGILSIEDADGGNVQPVMSKAVMSSTNISLVSTAGEDTVDSPNINMATLSPDGEHAKTWDEKRAEMKAKLTELDKSGEISDELADLLGNVSGWKSEKRKQEAAQEAVDGLPDDVLKKLGKALTGVTGGLSKNGGSYTNKENIAKMLYQFISQNASSALSGAAGNSISKNLSKALQLLSTQIKIQKSGKNQFIATSIDLDTKKPITEKIIAEYNTDKMLSAKKLNIDTDNVGDGLVLEGVTVTGNTEKVENFGKVADKSIEAQGGSSKKKYFAQPIVIEGRLFENGQQAYNRQENSMLKK